MGGGGANQVLLLPWGGFSLGESKTWRLVISLCGGLGTGTSEWEKLFGKTSAFSVAVIEREWNKGERTIVRCLLCIKEALPMCFI